MTEETTVLSWRQKGINALSILLFVFVFYTCATGPFESVIHRAIFVAILITLGLFMYPLWSGTRLRPLGLVIDVCM
jgi:TRAP-type uncharacterized transport system fused permease subunit